MEIYLAYLYGVVKAGEKGNGDGMVNNGTDQEANVFDYHDNIDFFRYPGNSEKVNND